MRSNELGMDYNNVSSVQRTLERSHWGLMDSS